MGTTVKLKESSNVFDPDTGQFFPVTALDLFRQGGITARDYPDYFSDAVRSAQQSDALQSAVEEGRLPAAKTQFKYGFTDDPEVAKADYERRIPQVIAEGGDPSMLQEALRKLQTQDPNIVLDEDDEGDDKESLTFEDFVNPLLTFFDPSTIVGPLGPIDMGELYKKQNKNKNKF